MQSIVKVLSLLSIVNFTQSALAEVTWQEQAERLQLVNAASIDAAPIGEPVTDKTSMGFRSIVSILPKIDSTVGAKTEKVPASPVHAVPTGVFEFARPMSGSLNFGGTLWAGYLPKGVEKLLGIKASLVQYLAGLSVLAEVESGSLAYYSHIGFQYVNAKARGAITATDATDAFDSTTSFAFISPGLRHKSSGIWSNVLLGYRNNKSTFLISESGTNLALDDKTARFLTQGTIGWQHKSGVQLAVSEQFIPNRVLMPRVTLGYHYAFDGGATLAENFEAVPMIQKVQTPQNKTPVQPKSPVVSNKIPAQSKAPVAINKTFAQPKAPTANVKAPVVGNTRTTVATKAPTTTTSATVPAAPIKQAPSIITPPIKKAIK